MKRIAIVTSNRAEYGILSPLIRKVEADSEFLLELIVTGAHLSEKYGNTIEQIRSDGFPIKATIPILENGNSVIDISVTLANAIKEFSIYFNDNKPDILVLLGDRTELLGVAIAAMNCNIPIAHLHGGEVTKGAVDDCVRHAITKLSYIHFAGTEIYKNRIIQMGEDPSRVFNVGTLSAENILKTTLMKENELREDIGIPQGMKYAVVTLHPETVDALPPRRIANVLCKCMQNEKDTFFVITASNSDVGGDVINDTLIAYADNNSNAVFRHSLGMRRYLSAVKYSLYVLGNSSSGIVEAPILGVPTINVGNRQSGRIMVDTILNVPFEKYEIEKAIDKASIMEHIPSKIYGDGCTSEKMVSILKQVLSKGIELKKGFYDIGYLDRNGDVQV